MPGANAGAMMLFPNACGGRMMFGGKMVGY
jgi:hypothetical protein